MKRVFLFPSFLLHGLIVLAVVVLTVRVVTKSRKPPPPSVINVISERPPPPPAQQHTPPRQEQQPLPPPVAPPVQEPRRTVVPPRTVATNRPVVAAATNVIVLPPRQILPPRVVTALTNTPTRPPQIVRTAQELESQQVFEEAQKRFEEYAHQLEQGRSNRVVIVDPLPGSESPVSHAFMLEVQKRIRAAWQQPSNVVARCEIAFRLHRNGTVTDVAVEKKSGVQGFDAAAENAVKKATHPPLPAELSREYVDMVAPFVTE